MSTDHHAWEWAAWAWGIIIVFITLYVFVYDYFVCYRYNRRAGHQVRMMMTTGFRTALGSEVLGPIIVALWVGSVAALTWHFFVRKINLTTSALLPLARLASRATCSSGHSVARGDAYCSKCGEGVGSDGD